MKLLKTKCWKEIAMSQKEIPYKIYLEEHEMPQS